MIKFFKNQYHKVFRTERMTFSDRFFLALPKVPHNVTTLLMTVVMFKYLTDVVLLEPLVVGSLFFLLSIWNAVNDPLIGIFLDRMKYVKNKGKYVFMAKISVPLIGVSMLAIMFASSSWADWLVYIYILTMFIIYEIGMTAYEISINSYVFIRLRNSEERLEYSVINTYMTYIISAVITMIPLIMFVGDQPVEYITPILAIVITINALFFWVSLRKLKEDPKYYKNDITNTDAQLAKDLLLYTKDIVKSKGFWSANFLTYTFNISVAYYFTFFLYYMDDIVNATSIQSIIMDLSNGVILLLVIPFIPSIQRKLGIKTTYFLIVIPAIVGFSALYFVSNIWFVFIAFVLIVITNGAQMTLLVPTLSLVIDEDWQKTGTRKVAYITALSALVKKPAAGLRAMLFGGVLTYYGYDGALGVQTASAIKGLRISASIIPVITMLLALVCISLLPYNREYEQKIIKKRKLLEEEGQLDERSKLEEDIISFD